MIAETALHRATDRPTWRRLIHEKGARVAAFERHVLPLLVDGLRPGASVLEIGCGLGWASAVLAYHRPDLRVVATDLVAPYLSDHARRLADFFGVKIAFVASDAEWLPFPDGMFDRVFSQMVLYRLPAGRASALREFGRPVRTIAWAYRALAPGGRWLAIERAAPWCWPWSARERRRFERRNRETGLSERSWTRRQWEGLFAAACVPARFAWATRTGSAIRALTNAIRAEHLLVTVERP
mgnify:CR=1 FL=1